MAKQQVSTLSNSVMLEEQEELVSQAIKYRITLTFPKLYPRGRLFITISF